MSHRALGRMLTAAGTLPGIFAEFGLAVRLGDPGAEAILQGVKVRRRFSALLVKLVHDRKLEKDGEIRKVCRW